MGTGQEPLSRKLHIIKLYVSVVLLCSIMLERGDFKRKFYYFDICIVQNKLYTVHVVIYNERHYFE